MDPLIFKPKRNASSSQWLQKLMDLNIKCILLINKKTLLNILDTFNVESWKENWSVYLWIMYCHLTGLCMFKNRLKHTQLNVFEKEQPPCCLYLIQIFGSYKSPSDEAKKSQGTGFIVFHRCYATIYLFVLASRVSGKLA